MRGEKEERKKQARSCMYMYMWAHSAHKIIIALDPSTQNEFTDLVTLIQPSPELAVWQWRLGVAGGLLMGVLY